MYLSMYTVTHNMRNSPCFNQLTNKYLLPNYSNQDKILMGVSLLDFCDLRPLNTSQQA